MKKYKIVSLLVVLIFSLNIYAQQTLTLTDAIDIALSQNTDIVTSKNSLGTYKKAIKSAYGNFLPSLGVSGSWGWQRTSSDGGTTQIDYFGEEAEVEASQSDSRSYSLSASGNITLFDGLSSFANLDEKKNEYKGARLDFDKLRQDIIYQTADYFFTVIGYKKMLEYQQENYDYNKKLLDKMKEMLDLSMISIADYYSQEVETANAESSLMDAQTSAEKAKVTLLDYLSMDISQDYEFTLADSEKEYTDYNNSTFEELSEIALANRKDYQSKKLELENAKSELKVARADYMPTITGSYGLSTSAVSPGDLFNRRVYSLGLSLNLPIFSGWDTEYSVESAKVDIKNTEEELHDLERSIKSDVMSVLLDLKNAKKQVEVTEKAIKSAEESWKVNKESYEIGKATYLEMQEAYSSLLSAQNDNVQAVYDYYSTNYELRNLIGNLSLED